MKKLKAAAVTLYFETHSTSLDNEARLASGWFDVDLSPRGEAQARALGERYAAVALDAIHTSDLKRAWRTAELAFGAERPHVRDPRLRECDYGSLTRAPTEAVDAERLARIDEPFPGGESYSTAVARLRGWLAEVAGERRHGTVLLIGHRVTWYALEHLLAGRDLRDVIAQPLQWQPGWRYELRRLMDGHRPVVT